ncbi:hypothetical protein [Nocardia pseudobrasiliensis]|uniref:Uncharacterized protein n=1 Tax=Nocardia pseudobrasiliensis TaxID=45979 RepID=A0A370HQR2_9NOCA|nr:hypothetical protein [Nocardia pseudobrasiliensis]RDI60301.1 hypothetical protein DFR76_11633 [Nocardia pseudobrasiliensis]
MSDRPGGAIGWSPLSSAFALTGAISSQAFLLTAVLYYFGWVYTHAWYAYYGVEVGMLGYSVTDYTLRSINTAFWPVVAGLLIALILQYLRHLPAIIAIGTRRPRRVLRWWVGGATVWGAGLVAVVAVSAVFRSLVGPVLNFWLPYLLMAGALLLVHAALLRSKYAALIGRARRRRTRTRPPQILLSTLIALAVVGLVWGIGTYADRQGATDARNLAEYAFTGRPSVLVLSTDRLGLEGTGTQVGEISVPGERYHYVYSGLRLLTRTSDAYILIPQQWKRFRDRVFVIPRIDGIRIDLATSR